MLIIFIKKNIDFQKGTDQFKVQIHLFVCTYKSMFPVEKKTLIIPVNSKVSKDLFHQETVINVSVIQTNWSADYAPCLQLIYKQ